MTEKKTVVKVTIGSEEYTLKSDRPAEYTRAVAEHVDRALKEIISAGARVETHKAAILAALAITDELFQERRAARELADRVTNLATDLCRVLPPAKRTSRATGSFASAADGR
ncbi:MAG: cell division protein ZapA [Gemmatimonadota bacterium]|nr:MAG: cell division protein ZapA [Gemmatimonadota bacterium]